jgi:hypothetical protein
MLGRVVISILFIPSYFRGELLTVYQLLERRFGNRIKMLAASLFVVMRNIADGIRLLLTAIVVAAVYTAFQPNVNPEIIIAAAVILLGLVMLIFTYYGGMEAVIWVEVIQLGIYIAGAVAAALVLLSHINGGFEGAVAAGRQFAKFDLIDFGFRSTPYSFALPFTSSALHFNLPIDFTKTYTFWAGPYRRMFSDDEHARYRPVSRAKVPLHRSSAARGHGLAFEWGGCVRAVRRIPIHWRSAVRLLSAIRRSRLCERNRCGLSVHRGRPGLSRFHHEAHAFRIVRTCGGRHFRSRAFFVAQLDCRQPQ